MTTGDRFEQRLAAVERAVVDGDYDLTELADLGSVIDDVKRIDDRLDEFERRLAEVEGTVQAMSGFVGKVQSVNEDVEHRADTAVATVDRLERRIGVLEQAIETEESAHSTHQSVNKTRPTSRTATAPTDSGSTELHSETNESGEPIHTQTTSRNAESSPALERTVRDIVPDKRPDQSPNEHSDAARNATDPLEESGSTEPRSQPGPRHGTADQQVVDERLAETETSSTDSRSTGGEDHDSNAGSVLRTLRSKLP